MYIQYYIHEYFHHICHYNNNHFHHNDLSNRSSFNHLYNILYMKCLDIYHQSMWHINYFHYHSFIHDNHHHHILDYFVYIFSYHQLIYRHICHHKCFHHLLKLYVDMHNRQCILIHKHYLIYNTYFQEQKALLHFHKNKYILYLIL